jgi:hypothetical protein
MANELILGAKYFVELFGKDSPEVEHFVIVRPLDFSLTSDTFFVSVAFRFRPSLSPPEKRLIVPLDENANLFEIKFALLFVEQIASLFVLQIDSKVGYPVNSFPWLVDILADLTLIKLYGHARVALYQL